MKEIACKVMLKGRVTGVGFRWAALERASQIPGLKGYVCNLGHGEVEVFLQGERIAVDSMLEWLGRGPAWARVDEMNLVDVEPDPSATSFEIKEGGSWLA